LREPFAAREEQLAGWGAEEAGEEIYLGVLLHAF